MSKTYEECMLAILATPEDDQLRRELATIVRASDPAWAELIELQLALSDHERARLPHSTSHREYELLAANERRWSRNLDFYLGELGIHRHVEFIRGLPWRCTLNPYMFLEQGEYILMRVAPLRGIEFYADPDGAPFPAKELAASPLLARLDEIRFQERTLAEGDLEIIVASPHLERARTWWFQRNPVSAAVWEIFASNPLTRRALMVRNDYEVPSDRGPLGEATARFDTRPNRHFQVSAEGAALERRYGYQPWLHFANGCDPADAHYWEAQGVLPMFVPGSPIDAPIALGQGLGYRRSLEPRSAFDLDAQDFVAGPG